MRGALLILGLIMVVASATWAYKVNYRTQAALDRVAQLERDINAEAEAISVLQAEWAYLNRPERLRALAELHFAELQLMPLHPDHFSDPRMVVHPVPEDPLLAEMIEAAVQEAQEVSE